MRPSNIRVGQVTPHMLLIIGGSALAIALLLLAASFFLSFFGTGTEQATRNNFMALGNAMNSLKATNANDLFSYVEMPMFLADDFLVVGFSKGERLVAETCPTAEKNRGPSLLEKGPECGNSACICLYRHTGGTTADAGNFEIDTCTKIDADKIFMLGSTFWEKAKADLQLGDWTDAITDNFRGASTNPPTVPIDKYGDPYQSLVMFGECERKWETDTEFDTLNLYIERVGREITVTAAYPEITAVRRLAMEIVEKQVRNESMLREDKQQILREMSKALELGAYGEVIGLYILENRKDTRSTWRDFERLQAQRQELAAIAAYELVNSSTPALEHEASELEAITGTKLTPEEMRTYLSLDYPGKQQDIKAHQQHIETAREDLQNAKQAAEKGNSAKVMKTWYERLEIPWRYVPPEMKFTMEVLAAEAAKNLTLAPPQKQEEAYYSFTSQRKNTQQIRQYFIDTYSYTLQQGQQLLQENPELRNHEMYQKYLEAAQ